MFDSQRESLPPTLAATLDPEARRTARNCLSLMGVLGVCSWIGVASSLYLLTAAPLLLVALSPIGRHLLLVAPLTNPVAFVGVAVARRATFYLASFRLGRVVGRPGLSWLDGKARWAASWVRLLERIFDWAPLLVVFLMLGPIMSSIAGMSGMSARVFTGGALAGLTARMIVTVYFAEWMRAPLETIIAWLTEYRAPGTALLVVGALIYQLVQRRARRKLAEG